MTQTLLERWDKHGMASAGFHDGIRVSDDEIRRALAVAQAVEEFAAQDVAQGWKSSAHHMLRRADELLNKKG